MNKEELKTKMLEEMTLSDIQSLVEEKKAYDKSKITKRSDDIIYKREMINKDIMNILISANCLESSVIKKYFEATFISGSFQTVMTAYVDYNFQLIPGALKCEDGGTINVDLEDTKNHRLSPYVECPDIYTSECNSIYDLKIIAPEIKSRIDALHIMQNEAIKEIANIVGKKYNIVEVDNNRFNDYITDGEYVHKFSIISYLCQLYDLYFKKKKDKKHI